MTTECTVVIAPADLMGALTERLRATSGELVTCPDSDIARAWTLPAALYTDADVFAAEKERVFSRTWQVVGHDHGRVALDLIHPDQRVP
jgi:hypothetical protein